VRLGKFLVVTTLVLATGLHWAALQTVAWTTMLASNLRCECFSDAVCQTFDGKHPCCLCKAIAAAKKSQKKSEAAGPVLKMEFPMAAGQLVLIPPVPSEGTPSINAFAKSLSSEPPLPPPRSLAV
jgi:hypothetical protein